MKILVADDDPASCRLLERLLSFWGYVPVVVHDGPAALDALLGPDAPRLALLDWLMPAPDGAQVCRALRAGPAEPYTYVVLLTGRGDRASMLEGLEAGADDFLAKPVDEAELRARLNAGRRVLLLQEQLLESQRQLRERATRDALTGLWNRAAVLDLLDRELARARREGRPLAVALADLDHFKAINDAHGHLAGDAALREAARRMAAAVRPYDGLGRYGGEEFLAVLPGCDVTTASALAGRLRQTVAAGPVDAGAAQIAVTASLGVAACAAGGAEAAELLRAADAALYRAKGAGRDRVCVGDFIAPQAGCPTAGGA